MEEIFKLIEEQKIQKAIELIQANLVKEPIDEEFIEQLINNLSRLYAKSKVILKSLLPNLLKLIGIKNDVLRYSLLLDLKPVCESDPEMILTFSSEYLNSSNPNEREGMLQLLTFTASAHPEIFEDKLEEFIKYIGDKEEYVQKKAMDLLKTLGKTYPTRIEKGLVDYISNITDLKIRENADNVIKTLVNIKQLEDQEIEKKKLELSKKVLDEKEKKVEMEETKLKEEEIKKREELLRIKQKKKEKIESLKEKEKKLIEKEVELKEKELRLKEAQLMIDEKKKELEEERIKREAEILEKERELSQKKAELELVKKEFEMKNIEKEKEAIIQNEIKRIKKELEQLREREKEESEDSYEDMDLEDK
ncbi:MAG: hypothetical protein ACTSU2_16295 [Promethearchaeota archaeon]